MFAATVGGISDTCFSFPHIQTSMGSFQVHPLTSLQSVHLSSPISPTGVEALNLSYLDYSKFSWMVLPTTHLFPLKTLSFVSLKRKTQIFDMANGPHFSGPGSHIFSLAVCAPHPIPLYPHYNLGLLQVSPLHFTRKDIPDSVENLPGFSMAPHSFVSTYVAQLVSPTKLSALWKQWLGYFPCYVSNV